VETYSYPNWHSALVCSNTPELLPKRPGIYIYAEVHQVAGLVTSTTWLYVGRASNLARRIRQHDAKQEKNHLLSRRMKSRAEITLLYTTLPLSDTFIYEKLLVKELNPLCNIIRFTKNS
jgi:excinuclease UvrABC nuclease subunit